MQISFKVFIDNLYNHFEKDKWPLEYAYLKEEIIYYFVSRFDFDSFLKGIINGHEKLEIKNGYVQLKSIQKVNKKKRSKK